MSQSKSKKDLHNMYPEAFAHIPNTVKDIHAITIKDQEKASSKDVKELQNYVEKLHSEIDKLRGIYEENTKLRKQVYHLRSALYNDKYKVHSLKKLSLTNQTNELDEDTSSVESITIPQIQNNKKDSASKKDSTPSSDDKPSLKPYRQGITGGEQKLLKDDQLPSFPKDKKVSDYLKYALSHSKFFKELGDGILTNMVSMMEINPVTEHVTIIREGEEGDYMYICYSGQVSVSTKAMGDVAVLGEGKIFGELALLHNAKRNATVKTANTECVLYKLKRQYFSHVMQQYIIKRDNDRMKLLKSVPDLRNLGMEKLRKIVDSLEEEKFLDGDCIIRQGSTGDLFYIIASGQAKVTKNSKDNTEQKLAILNVGQYFGERALQTSDTRSANVYAHGKVTTLALDRENFTKLIGKITDIENELKNLSLSESIDNKSNLESVDTDKDNNSMKSIQKVEKEKGPFDDTNLRDIRELKVLGIGGFGKVRLVFFDKNGMSKKLYALKCISKDTVVKTKQQIHINSERKILCATSTKFIAHCYKTYRDNKQVYLLLDAFLGGDMWKLLNARGPFPDTVSRFYAACVIEALSYLHSRNIVYRDLKPENLMLNSNGYLTLVDLGFAKKLTPGQKTFTFCGTPEYIPPEVLKNIGHGLAVDYWGLGIFIYELSAKKTPFKNLDDLAIYSAVLKGIRSVHFSNKVSKKAESLIMALCKKEPSERLGYQKEGINGIRRHKWFAGFDWEAFKAQKVGAPILPEIRDYMKEYHSKIRMLPDPNYMEVENSGWDVSF